MGITMTWYLWLIIFVVAYLATGWVMAIISAWVEPELIEDPETGEVDDTRILAMILTWALTACDLFLGICFFPIRLVWRLKMSLGRSGQNG